ncbi:MULTISPECIES: recombination protein NinG [Rahnella]|uniref:Recombination protein NinG n=1 Tax=Rahnella laticis TaxID=2787622 RepID=A0ABS0DZ49_9GAMM|nr:MULTISPECIES: recombination protein NinG [Rahnella]MBF7978102.1 recombination protein NinG [Rahnella laticis]MBF7998181.1 recombination protein NinG [Rahnella sp. LAC-M12]
MKLPRSRNCKICKKRFKPATLYDWWCSEEHKEELITKLATEARQKRIQQQEQQRKQTTQQERRSLKIRKLAVQPRSYFIKQAQQAVNAYIRERDKHLPCVSCGTLSAAQWDAGHYRTTAAAPQLRFDPRQIWKQCSVCNQHKSGNLVPYRAELIRRIGLAEVESIEGNHDRHRWTIEECKAIKAEYQQKLKDLRQLGEEA